MPPSANFQIVRKSQLRAGGPWRIRPFVRLKRGQLFFIPGLLSLNPLN
jgi:hypothetical protein